MIDYVGFVFLRNVTYRNVSIWINSVLLHVNKQTISLLRVTNLLRFPIFLLLHWYFYRFVFNLCHLIYVGLSTYPRPWTSPGWRFTGPRDLGSRHWWQYRGQLTHKLICVKTTPGIAPDVLCPSYWTDLLGNSSFVPLNRFVI